MQPTYYVGLDVHKKFVYGCIIQRNGTVEYAKKFKNEPHELDQFLAFVRKNDAEIALESCVCWQYIYDYLSDAGYNVALAHPLKVKAIAETRKKTDRHDAKLLADLLRMRFLPQSYAAPWDIRFKRQITRHRLSLVGLQTEIKNKIHAILLRHGIDLDERYSDVFGKAGMEYLKSLELPYCDRFELDQYLSLLESIWEKIGETQERIEEMSSDDPQARLLMSIPGISYYAALMIKAEIGDVHRFDSYQKLISYAGLNPSVYQSGNTFRTGHISKQGSRNLRWILIQTAHIAVMHDKTLARFYHRLRRTKHNKIAIVATARKMLKYIYTMLKHNIRYQALQVHKKAS